MKNWKEYVGYQKSSLTLFYLTTHATPVAIDDENPHVSFTIERIKLTEKHFTIPERNVGGIIEQLLYQFPHKEPTDDKFDFHRHSLNVARESRRGMANKNWKNVWYYSGQNAFDSPILVAEHNGKYAVVKHPAFEKYGFVMKKYSLWQRFLKLFRK